MGDCHQAGSGDEAIVKVRAALDANDPYDVIFMDIMMPGMSGHDAAKAIRGLEKERNVEKRVDIVMLTGLNSTNEAMDSFCNAQSSAYLVKPVSKDGLYNVMSKLGLMHR
ncbi:response regulator [Geomonas sp. Red32]|nr:response regulator [Geomonas sp. Red32]